jgi:cobalt/nickel transport system permease protein
MGIVGSFAGYAVYRLVTAMAGGGRKTILAASFAGSWCAIVLASVAAAFELAISGSSPLQIVLPAMTGVHALIGIGEGLITTAVLGVVLATRADLMPLKRMHAEGDAK